LHGEHGLYEIPIALRFYLSGFPTRSGARYCREIGGNLCRRVDAGQSHVSPSGVCWHPAKKFRSEHPYDGPRDGGARSRLLRLVDRLCVRVRSAVGDTDMTFDYSLAALVTAGLLIYLIYALLKPELF
jgi:K+-transporting ATPase KdpF subunit